MLQIIREAGLKNFCDELGLKFYAPLWDYSHEMIWDELFKNNFKVILTKLSCEGIPKELLGEIVDERIFLKLKRLSEKYKFRSDFEGGEAETTVLYMPEFNSEIKIKFDIKSEGEYLHFLENLNVR